MPKAITVGQGEADYATITEALEAAPAGAKILVRPGTYREKLKVEGKVQITGDGAAEEIVLEVKGNDLELAGDGIKLKGLTIRSTEAIKGKGAVLISGGAPELNGCRISAAGGAGVWVSGGTPTLRKCLVWDTNGMGVFCGGGETTLISCEVRGNSNVGVEVVGARAVLDRCKVLDNESNGVWVESGAEVTVLKGQFKNNAEPNLAAEGAVLKMDGCKVLDGRSDGVCFISGSRGEVQGCTIKGNAQAGLAAWKGSVLQARGCTVQSNGGNGVWIFDDGEATLEDCKISKNTSTNLAARGARVTARGCEVFRGKSNGVVFFGDGSGLLEDCDIHGNKLADVGIWEGGDPVLRRCKIHKGKDCGAYVFKGGRGTFEDCELYDYKGNGATVDASAPTFRRCTFHDNGTPAAWRNGASGRVEECTFTDSWERIWITDDAEVTLADCNFPGEETEVLDHEGAGAWLVQGLTHSEFARIRVALAAGLTKPPAVVLAWRGKNGETALQNGLSVDTIKLVRLMAPHQHEELDEYGRTALMQAVPYPEAVRALLDAGADVNAVGGDDTTVLHNCSKPDSMQLLLEAGADPIARDNYQRTPLITVAGSYCSEPQEGLDALKLLLEAGAELEARDKFGETALFRAAYCGSVEKVRFLLEAGADPAARSEADRTPVDRVSSDNPELRQVLLDAGATAGDDLVQTMLEEKIKPHARKASKPKTRKGNPGPAAAKFGGMPFLPAGTAWPTCEKCGAPALFLVQLDLSDLAPACELRGEGLAQMFFCDPCGKHALRVVDPTGEAAEAGTPDGVKLLPSRAITGWTKPKKELPGRDVFVDTVPVDLSDAERDMAWGNPFTNNGDKCGGWPHWIQDPQWGTAPSGRPFDRLVLQMDTGGNLPYQFGDSGIGFILGTSEDPLEFGFVWQCL